MLTSLSTHETEDLEQLDDFNSCFEKDDLLFDSPEKQRQFLGDLNSLINRHDSLSTNSTDKFMIKKLPSLDSDDKFNLNIQPPKTKWQTRLEQFYELLDKLIAIDQQIVYLKNLTNRLGADRQCECPHLQEQLKMFTVWEYLSEITPSPSQEQILISNLKLVRVFEQSKKIFNTILITFTKQEAEKIFKDLDLGQKGTVDKFDVISKMEERTGRTFEVKDVINLFRRLTRNDELTVKEFVGLFQ